MRRFIDVDVLEADVECWENHDDPKQPDYDTRDIEQVIGSQPIVDAVEVVRCKDCVHNQLPPTSGNANCELWYGMTDLYGYCSSGERKKMEDER